MVDNYISHKTDFGTNQIKQSQVEGLEKAIDTLAKQGIRAIDRISDTKHNLDVFQASQDNFNEYQSGINLTHFTLIKEIHKTLIIGFSVLVFFMLVTWSYLLYTFLHK